MYKMYNAQWDQEEDDDKDSLGSSFWSDGERREDEDDEEEEKVEVERVVDEEKPAAKAEDEQKEEEKPELNYRVDVSTMESFGDGEEGSDDDDDDDDERCSSDNDSPVPSLMTSGYGTYRPEERDDRTIAEFDQDSRGDFSEMRDDDDDEDDDEEDDRSLSSFGGFHIEPPAYEPDYGETFTSSVFKETKQEEVESQTEELKFENKLPVDLQEVFETSERSQRDIPVAEDESSQDGKKEESLIDLEEVKEYESFEEEDVQDLSVESHESSSNKDIKFIDSKADPSWRTYMEQEGNLRHKKKKERKKRKRRREAASCLEDRLAELHLSGRPDSETENRDDSDSRSYDTDEMSAFQSYIRGMNRTQSDVEFRPKPKSFIRPIMNQQTKKKTDPVAKYFQYKQLWEMFKLPGETDRRAVRSEIKERLAYQPPPPKPRRVYVRNTYTVPTEKKRSALRWEIRNDLANGLLPYKYSYRY